MRDCSFRAVCNLGRALGVQCGDPGGKPCRGPVRIWKNGDMAHDVCAAHEGEFRYWYRGAVLSKYQPRPIWNLERLREWLWYVGFKLRWWAHSSRWIPIVWDWDNDRPRLRG